MGLTRKHKCAMTQAPLPKASLIFRSQECKVLKSLEYKEIKPWFIQKPEHYWILRGKQNLYFAEKKQKFFSSASTDFVFLSISNSAQASE